MAGVFVLSLHATDTGSVADFAADKNHTRTIDVALRPSNGRRTVTLEWGAKNNSLNRVAQVVQLGLTAKKLTPRGFAWHGLTVAPIARHVGAGGIGRGTALIGFDENVEVFHRTHTYEAMVLHDAGHLWAIGRRVERGKGNIARDV